MARRGWLTPADVLNTYPFDNLRAALRRQQALVYLEPKFADVFRARHPASLRCSSLTYAQ